MADSTTAASSSTPLGKIVILTILGLGIGAFLYFELGQYFSLEALKANRNTLLAYTDANFATAVALFIGVYIIQTGFSLPGGAIMTLTGGFLFGSVLGTIFVNIGATIGATLAFWWHGIYYGTGSKENLAIGLSPFKPGLPRTPSAIS